MNKSRWYQNSNTAALALAAAAVAGLPINTTAGDEFRILSISQEAPGKVNITWRSDDGASYRVERSVDLINWGPLGTVAGSAGGETSYLDDEASDTHRYYRIALVGTEPPPGMSLIPTGPFEMGGVWEVPVHAVMVSAFYMDRLEVTKALWNEVRNWGILHGYTDLRTGIGQGASHPILSINWYDVVKWCNARSEKEELQPVYYTDATRAKVYKSGRIDLAENFVDWSANGYRLPTEAEWEKAARGTLAGKEYPWGNGIDGGDANYSGSGDPFDDLFFPPGDRTPETTPVGYYDGNQVPAGPDRANGYGLHDMAGNVEEWCWDYYDGDWYSQPGATMPDTHGPKIRPDVGPNSPDRISRGGDWNSESPFRLRCYDRVRHAASTVGLTIGFRTARGL